MNINDSPYKDLIVLCNGCGESMRDMGTWPCQFPKDDKPKNIQMSHRYTCQTCRIPSDKWDKGMPALISIIIPE